MKQEWAHRQDSTAETGAHEFSVLIAQSLGLVCRQPTMPVRPGHDPERTTLRATVVEVHAHRDEGFEHGRRWWDVQNAFLLRPTCPLRMLDSFANRNAEVLV